MIRSGLILIIREKKVKGKSAYAIGNNFSISKNTTKKYMKPGTIGQDKRRGKSKLDPFNPRIQALMNMIVSRDVRKIHCNSKWASR